jgi:hypothetical protein
MLIFITVTMVDKSRLTAMDWFIMVNFWICLVAGLAIVPKQPYALAVFWLILSCVTYLPCLYLPFYDSNLDCIRFLENTYNKSALTHEWSDDELHVIAERRAKQFNIAVWLTVALPLYTVNYLIALWGGFDVPTTIVVYQVSCDGLAYCSCPFYAICFLRAGDRAFLLFLLHLPVCHRHSRCSRC